MQRFKNILYVFEPTIDPGTALERAVSLAENNQARLTIVEVIPAIDTRYGLLPGEPDAEQVHESFHEQRLGGLEELIAPFRHRLSIRIKVLEGTTFLEVIRAVLQHEYDLVIKSAEDPDYITRLFGSDDIHLLRKCPAPVWLMRPEERPNYGSIVAAVDFDPLEADSVTSTLNQLIIALASSLAVSDFARLHVVHAWEAPAETLLRGWSDNPAQATRDYAEAVRHRHQHGLHELRAHLRERIGTDAYTYIEPEFHLYQGSPKRVIPEAAHQLGADLVVMGTVARTGIAGLFIGNTAEAILEQLQCSVLAVKPPGFVSPVAGTHLTLTHGMQS